MVLRVNRARPGAIYSCEGSLPEARAEPQVEKGQKRKDLPFLTRAVFSSIKKQHRPNDADNRKHLMPDTAKALELLSNVDIFANLDKKELIALADIAQTESHKAGKIVYRQGDNSDSFGVVLSGTFDVYLWDDLLKIERPLTSFKRGDVFGEMGLLTDEPRSAFVRAKHDGETLRFNKEAFFSLLEKQPKVTLALARTLAHRLNAANKARGLKLERLASYSVKKESLQLLPLQVILRHKVLPIAKEENQVTVALVDPSDLVARNTVTEFLGKYHVLWVCISQPDFEHFRDKRLFDLVNEGIPVTDVGPAEIVYLTGKSGPGLEPHSASARALDDMLRDAIDAHASDLHFEPGPPGVTVRARIDGRLVELAPIMTFHAYRSIVSRIKVLSDLDITETRLPQDSVLRIRYGNRNIDLRVSIVPCPRGESVAFRLFDPQQRKLDLHNLIVAEPVAEQVKKLFSLPSGLVLVTGPTGSGKTTTLYAGIQARREHSPTHKLVTAEDPIEYELNGATQVQVKPLIGLTFEQILRSILRQDPNIILIGEIRDKASMEIALEASLTGHLVLSSLHTSDVFETVMRIRQRGIEPYVIASALRGVISQRLLPRLCSACAEEIPSDRVLLEQLRASGIIGLNEALKLWKASGCTHCRMNGTKGLVGLYEVLVVTLPLRNAIERGATLQEIEQSAPPACYISMKRYAKYLLEKGLVAPKDLLEIFPPASATAVGLP